MAGYNLNPGRDMAPRDDIEAVYFQALADYEKVRADYVAAMGLERWYDPFHIVDSLERGAAHSKLSGFDDERARIVAAYASAVGLGIDTNESERMTAVNDMAALLDATKAAFGTTGGQLDPDLSGQVFRSSEYKNTDAGPVNVPGAPDLKADLKRDADVHLLPPAPTPPELPSFGWILAGLVIVGGIALYAASKAPSVKPSVTIG